MFDYIAIIKLILAAALGAIIGMERKAKHFGIGVRTASLISLSACLFTISALTFFNATNIARVVQGLAAGVGFIGAAIIWRERQEKQEKRAYLVAGLTTAVTVWFLTALGIFVAIGYYFEAIAVTFIALIILLLKKANIE